MSGLKQSAIRVAQSGWFALALSIVLHACLLFIRASFLLEPARFAVRRGDARLPGPVAVDIEYRLTFTPPPREPQPSLPEIVFPEDHAEPAVAENLPPPKPFFKSNEANRADRESRSDSSRGNNGAGVVRSASATEYLRNPAPPYPEGAMHRGIEGVVRLRAIVNAEGRVDALSVESSSGHEILDNAALKAVRKWRFQPAHIAGISQASTVIVPIRFTLSQ